MRMFDILAKKRDGGELTAEEIAFWITGCVRREIPDYQTTALLMAGRIRGFSLAETVEITNQMRYSGTVLNLETIPGIKADKHSSGGVGDKTSLIVMPIVAA
ncbi:MAG: thymidine phosphorylase, partial [Clostridiales bacterium]